MSYFGAAIGTFLGMMIGLVFFTNSWRLNFLPKEYDFVHQYGNLFVKTDKKMITYVIRSFVGMFFHPIVFIYVWGETGFLRLNFFNSTILSALVLLFVESVLFGLGIWFDVIKISPENLKIRVISLQIVVHLVTGVLMGYFFTVF
ncbi:hypothetical protein ACFL0D_01045 [Thermoproteota archaeon]